MRSNYVIATLIIALSFSSAYWIYHQNQSLEQQKVLNGQLQKRISQLETQLDHLKNNATAEAARLLQQANDQKLAREGALASLAEQLKTARLTLQSLTEKRKALSGGVFSDQDLQTL